MRGVTAKRARQNHGDTECPSLCWLSLPKRQIGDIFISLCDKYITLEMSMMNKRYGWLMGFLGFGGFLGIEGEPLFFLLFAGFGGFAYYWWNKFDGTDERLGLSDVPSRSGQRLRWLAMSAM